MDIIKVALLIIIGIVFIVYYLRVPQQFFLLYILVKPVVDRFSEEGATIGGVSIGYHYLAALIIPTMSIFYVIMNKAKLNLLPFKAAIILYFFSNLFAFLQEGNYTLDNGGYYIRVAFPLFLYFSIPFILKKETDILKLIRFTALSGIFPCIMIFLQRVGIIAQNRVAEGFGKEIYDRATGGYADSFSVALPIIISIFCILFILQYYKETNQKANIYKLLLFVLFIALFMTYHRMSFIVVTIVFLLWTFINRRYAVILTISVLLMFSFPLVVAFLPGFFADLYLTERGPGSTEKISDATFHGRGGVWRRFMKRFEESNGFHQLFGIEMAGRAPHNDYLRVLLTNGLIGLSVYLAILLFIGLKLLRTFMISRRRNDRVMTHFTLTALFIYIFYVLGSLTLTISLLSTLTWFFWIFSGITFYQHQVRQRINSFDLNGTLTPEIVTPSLK